MIGKGAEGPRSVKVKHMDQAIAMVAIFGVGPQIDVAMVMTISGRKSEEGQ